MRWELRRRRADGPTLRLAFRDPRCLLDGLALAQEIAWVEGCTADLERGVLEVRAPAAGDRTLAGLRERMARLEHARR